jgi:hypothetical protein
MNKALLITLLHCTFISVIHCAYDAYAAKLKLSLLSSRNSPATVEDRISSLDKSLLTLSKNVARQHKDGFTTGSQEYKLAAFYIKEIWNATECSDDWPIESMYTLIQNGQVNIIELFVNSHYPVAKRLHWGPDLVRGDESALKYLQQHGLCMQSCGQAVHDYMYSPHLTPSKLQVFFDAGLPNKYFGQNWLEWALQYGRYDLGEFAYNKGLKLSLRRGATGAYDNFKITPEMFIIYLDPSYRNTLQHLSASFGEQGMLLSQIPEDLHGSITRHIILDQDGKIKDKLYEP